MYWVLGLHSKFTREEKMIQSDSVLTMIVFNSSRFGHGKYHVRLVDGGRC